MIKGFLRKIEVNRAVLYALLAKSWSMVAGVVTVLVIATKFTPELQGYYYTFVGVMAFQFLVELGLGNVILQFASHEWSDLSLDSTGHIVGKGSALSRLQSLAQFAFQWYLYASIILTVILAVGGYYFFSRDISTKINWTGPWISLSILTGILFCLVPIWSLLEGCNQVASVYLYRLVQGICSSLIMWLAIYYGAGLWVTTLSSLAVLFCALGFLAYNYRPFLTTLLLKPVITVSRIDWRTEILPLQWRTTVTWLIGYFSFTLFTPVLFFYHGAVIAGQMGMTWNVISGISAISGSWIVPKVPQFGILIAQKRYEELDSIFWRTTKIVITMTILMAIVIFIAMVLLSWLNHPLISRLLTPLSFSLFLLAQVISVTFYPFSLYLRAHKREPLLAISVAQGILVAAFTILLGKYYSATGIATGYLIVNMALVPLVGVIWYRCKSEWHKS